MPFIYIIAVTEKKDADSINYSMNNKTNRKYL